MPEAEPLQLAALAESAAGLRLNEVPEPVRAHATRVMADTIGVIMAGHLQPEMVALAAFRSPLAPELPLGTSQVLAPTLPTTAAAEAAFLNGAAGTFLELDEGVRPTGHPAIHVLPAALAAAQAVHSSGAELLAAFLAGYEVTARLFATFRLRYPLHPHGHLGAVGAAVAVARLLCRPAAEPALIASALPLLTVWPPCYEGATVRNAWSGLAAAHGVTANRLAGAGFTGSGLALSSTFGELVGEVVDPTEVSSPVDPGALRITRDYLKLHSTCALAHGALDAIFSLGPLSSEQIIAIEVETVSNNLKLDRQARDNPLSTRFSIPYAVAAAIIHGHSRPEAMLPEARVHELAKRVQVRAAADLEAAWPDRSPARITVRLTDSVLRAQVDNPHGHYLDPADPGELRRKFEMLTWMPAASTVYERLLKLEQLPDVADLLGGPM